MANKKTSKVAIKKKPKKKPSGTTTPFRDVGSTVGGAIGSLLGRPEIGKGIGGWLGSGLGKIFGSGAYKLRKNSVMDCVARQVPFMHSTSETVIFRHREYLGDISSSSSFTSYQYAVNPGISASFPYLSAIAQNFQEYEFRGLVYEFKSTSSNALDSTNTALGSVILAAQYQADAPAFENKVQILNEMWAVDGKPAEDVILPIECSPKENPFKVQYVRTGPLAANQDIKMYDLCNVTVATVGSQATAVVGELWATYEVVLRKPRPASVDQLAVQSSIYKGTGATTSSYFGTIETGIDNIGLRVNATTVSFLTGASGNFSILMFWYGSSGTLETPTFTLSGCTNVNFAGGPTASSGADASQPSMMVQQNINITSPFIPASITLSGGTLPSGATAILQITPLNGDIVAT